MSDFTQRLAEQRANIWEQAKGLLDHASSEERDLSAEEQVQYDSMNADLDSIAERVRSLGEQEQRNADMDAAFAKIAEGREVPGAKPKTSNAEALRSFLKGEAGRGFDIPMELRADQTTTNAAGVIPQGFYGQLWEYMIETSSVLQHNPQILRTASGETIKLPRATAHPSAAAITEGAAISASDPTLGSVNSTVTKEGFLTQFTTELLTDSGVDLEGYLSRQAGVALGNAVGSAAVTAAIAAATAGVTGPTGTATTFGAQSTAGQGFDLLVDLFYSVIAPYRNSSSCGWLLSDPTAAKVRKIKSADGVYAWQAAVIAGQPDLILGKPVLTDTNVSDAAASTKSVLFGDWSSLVVRIAGGFRFERSDEFAFDADMTTFRAITRHGTVSVDPNALKSFVHSAT